MPAKKHIKYRARLLRPSCNFVEVTILEQSHLGLRFGISDSIFEHQGVILYSGYLFFRDPVNAFPMRNIVQDGVHKVLRMPVESYKKFKSAVEAYNSYFDGTCQLSEYFNKLKKNKKEKQAKKEKKKEPWQERGYRDRRGYHGV